MPAALRVAVIGAGIVGSAVAWSLARRGADVTLFERAPAAATGSTARSAAGLRHQFSLPENVRFSRFGAQRFDAFADEVGADAGFRRVGYLFLIPAADASRWADDRAMQLAEGIEVERWTREDLALRAPYVALEGVAEASFGPDDGVLDPHAATLGYLAAARGCGAAIRLASEVVALDRAGDRWRVVTTGAEDRFDRVVNAAGPWAGRVAALAGAHLPVTPSRRDVFVTAPVADLPRPTPLVIDAATGVWWRSEGERVLLGRSNPDEPPGFRPGVDWAWLEAVLEVALPRFPFLAKAALDRRASWWGWYEVTPDHLPAIGFAPDAPGLLHAAGFSGHGVQHAPATGHAIASLLLDGHGGGFDLAPFDPGRFLGSSPTAPTESRVV